MFGLRKTQGLYQPYRTLNLKPKTAKIWRPELRKPVKLDRPSFHGRGLRMTLNLIRRRSRVAASQAHFAGLIAIDPRPKDKTNSFKLLSTILRHTTPQSPNLNPTNTKPNSTKHCCSAAALSFISTTEVPVVLRAKPLIRWLVVWVIL